MQVRDDLSPDAQNAIVTLHAKYYAKHWGFGTFFEHKVAREVADFAARKTSPDLALIALDDQGVAASLILDLHDPASGHRGAHLRWFITADRSRGTGIGRDLMGRAVAHANIHSLGKIWLTTFAGLAPARHLYKSFGFELTREQPGKAWGTEVTQQEFNRNNS